MDKNIIIEDWDKEDIIKAKGIIKNKGINSWTEDVSTFDNPWVECSERLPKESKPEAHLLKLWVQTEKYGCTVAFFKDGVFMKDYSAMLIGVVRWMELPQPI